jgi:hypothetical protein
MIPAPFRFKNIRTDYAVLLVNLLNHEEAIVMIGLKKT